MEAAAYITFEDNIDLGLDKNDNLFIRQKFEDRTKETVFISLGALTPRRVENLHTYIDRLAELASTSLVIPKPEETA